MGICIFLLLVLLHLAAASVYFIVTRGRYRIRQSLAGKVYVVTGATAGIGKVTALELAKNGAKVYMLCRNPDKGRKVLNEVRQDSFNNDVHLVMCDLCSFDSVRKAAKQLLDTGDKIDCLINNAGIMRLVGAQRHSQDGHDEMMQANHLGHFRLTTLLLESLKKSKARIVNLSSIAGLKHWNNNVTKNFDVNDLSYTKTKYDGGKAYCWSKLANILFTKELKRKIEGSGASTNCCHPGAVASDLATANFGKVGDKILHFLAALGFYKTVEQGAMTSLYLATSPEVEDVSGEYFADCVPGRPDIYGLNRKLAEDLWAASERIVNGQAAAGEDGSKRIL